MKVHHIALVAKNVEEMYSFYTDLLGFKETRRIKKPNWDGQAIILSLGEFNLELFCWDNPKGNSIEERDPKKTGFNHIGIEVERIDFIYKRLHEAGAKVKQPKKGTSCTAYFFVQDPDGNSIEFYQE